MFIFMSGGMHNMNRFRAANNNKAVQYTVLHNSVGHNQIYNCQAVRKCTF